MSFEDMDEALKRCAVRIRELEIENKAWREQMKALAPVLRDLLQMIEKVP